MFSVLIGLGKSNCGMPIGEISGHCAARKALLKRR